MIYQFFYLMFLKLKLFFKNPKFIKIEKPLNEKYDFKM